MIRRDLADHVTMLAEAEAETGDRLRARAQARRQALAAWKSER